MTTIAQHFERSRPATRRKRHWGENDFRIVETSPAYDGNGGLNKFGYCAVCMGDMQQFTHDGKPGPIYHYNSHKHAKRLGIWPKR